jgi:hypothetical protein
MGGLGEGSNVMQKFRGQAKTELYDAPLPFSGLSADGHKKEQGIAPCPFFDS